MKECLVIELTPYEVIKFWSKVERLGDDECWGWKGTFAGGTNAAGVHYGVMRLKKTGRKQIRANRIAAFLAFGPPPSPYHFAVHSCDNPNCINNISHITWGLPEKNSADALEDGVLFGRRVPQGTENGMAKLTDDQVRAIRKDPRTQVAIAEAYGIKKLSVGRIKRRLSWKFLTD